MSCPMLLLGFDETDSNVVNLFQNNSAVSQVIDCGMNFDMAESLLQQKMYCIFAINTKIAADEIIAFAKRLPHFWRRGILVGDLDHDLVAKALNSRQFADYIVYPASEKAVNSAFDNLRYWKNFWLGILNPDEEETASENA